MSPMGEPFRSSGQAANPAQAWFSQADVDRDGRLVLAEIERDADRFFRSLDVDGDGEIAPAEMTRYETEVAPEVQAAGQMGGGFGRPGGLGRGSGRGGPPGAGGGGRAPRRMGGPPRRARPAGEGMGMMGLLGLAQPVAAADTDLNRGVSVAEFRRAAGQRFVRLDRSRDGALTLEELVLQPARQRRR